MSHAYQDASESAVESFKRIHGNGEQTFVHILSAGDRYIAIAADVDPREFEAVEGECIAYCPTKESAHERAVAYLETHPKGILGESENGGFGSKIMNGVRKLDDYGNSLQEQQNQQAGENQ